MVAELDDAPQPTPQAQPVTLVQFPLIWGRNVSPFCLKVESWLRLAEVPFNVRSSMKLSAAPKRKFPYIIDAGQYIGDSSLIIDHVKRTRSIDPDIGLSEDDLAKSHLIQRLFEEHLYFVMLYSRWVDPDGWAMLRQDFFASLPAMARPLIRDAARRQQIAAIKKQGLGHLTQAEIYERGMADLATISVILGDRPFFLGEQLTTVDAIAHGFLANILYVPIETPLKRDAQRFENLTAWCDAMENGLAAE